MKKTVAVLQILVIVLFLSAPLFAAAPMEAVRSNVNKVLAVLGDPRYKASSAKAAERDKLRVIYEQMFDDVELSKRTLSWHWNQMTVPQRKEFVNLFREVLEKAYADKILAYTDEKIVFEREIMASDTLADIRTKVVMTSKEIPITYRVILKKDTWKVYDVVIENVSLVLNYRNQFNEILARDTPEQLLDILRKKVKGQ